MNRPEQTNLEGVGPEKNEKVHRAILKYVQIRDERMALNREEGELKSALLGLMKEQGITHYSYHGVKADIEQGDETVKAKVEQEEPGPAQEPPL